MKKHIGFLFVALLAMLGASGVVTAQDADRTPEQTAASPSRYDIAAPWGVIDDQDVMAITLGFAKPVGISAPRSWDINSDGVIDVVDIGLVSRRYGCTAADPCYWWR